MLRVLTIGFLLLTSPVTVFALEGGRIGLFSDEAGSNCNLYDSGVGVLTVYVVHEMEDIGASAFMLQPTAGALISYLAESIPGYLVGAMGRTDTGIAIAYGGCTTGRMVVLTVLYSGAGVSDLCSRIEIVRDPREADHVIAPSPEWIDVARCNAGGRTWAEPSNLVINPDALCECKVDGSGTTAARSHTWGAIKAMYVD